MGEEIVCQECDRCGDTEDKLFFGPDPFNEEIYGDETCLCLCETCHAESQMQI